MFSATPIQVGKLTMTSKSHEQLNPFSKRLDSITDSIGRLVTREEDLVRDLQWYNTTDRKILGEELQEKRAKAESLILSLEKKEAEIAANQRDIDTLSSSLGSPFNPRNWIDNDQRELRRRRRWLKSVDKKRIAEWQEIEKSQQSTHKDIESIKANIQRYDSFDPECRQGELQALQDQIASKKKKAEQIADQKARIDHALEPLNHELKVLESRRETAELNRCRAKDLVDQLSTARNPYERAKIHEQCEDEFGQDSPRQVAKIYENEAGQLDQELRKVEKRAREIVERTSRKIERTYKEGGSLQVAVDHLNAARALVSNDPPKAVGICRLLVEALDKDLQDQEYGRITDYLTACTDKRRGEQYGRIVASIKQLANMNHHDYGRRSVFTRAEALALVRICEALLLMVGELTRSLPAGLEEDDQG